MLHRPTKLQLNMRYQPDSENNDFTTINKSYVNDVYDPNRKLRPIGEIESPVARYKSPVKSPVFFESSQMPPISQLIREKHITHSKSRSPSPRKRKPVIETSFEATLRSNQVSKQMYSPLSQSVEKTDETSPSASKLRIKKQYVDHYQNLSIVSNDHFNILKYKQRADKERIEDLLNMYRKEERATEEMLNKFISFSSLQRQQSGAKANTSFSNLNNNMVQLIVDKNIKIKKERLSQMRKHTGGATSTQMEERDKVNQSRVESENAAVIKGKILTEQTSRESLISQKKSQAAYDNLNSDLKKVLVNDDQTKKNTKSRSKAQLLKNSSSKSPKIIQQDENRVESAKAENNKTDFGLKVGHQLNESSKMISFEQREKAQSPAVEDMTKLLNSTITGSSGSEELLTSYELKLLPALWNDSVQKSRAFDSILKIDQSSAQMQNIMFGLVEEKIDTKDKIKRYKENVQYLKRHDTILKDFVISRCPSLIFDPTQSVQIPKDNLGLTDNHFERIHNYQVTKRQKPVLHQNQFGLEIGPKNKSKRNNRNKLSQSVALTSIPQSQNQIIKKADPGFARKHKKLSVIIEGTTATPTDSTYDLRRQQVALKQIDFPYDSVNINSKSFQINLPPQQDGELSPELSPTMMRLDPRLSKSKLPHLEQNESRKNPFNTINGDVQRKQLKTFNTKNKQEVGLKQHLRGSSHRPVHLPTITSPQTTRNNSRHDPAHQHSFLTPHLHQTDITQNRQNRPQPQTEAANSFLDDLIGSKPQIQPVNQPKKLKLYDNKRKANISSTRTKQQDTQLNLNNENLRQSLINWNRQQNNSEYLTAGIPKSLYFKNYNKGKIVQRKVIKIDSQQVSPEELRRTRFNDNFDNIYKDERDLEVSMTTEVDVREISPMGMRQNEDSIQQQEQKQPKKRSTNALGSSFDSKTRQSIKIQSKTMKTKTPRREKLQSDNSFRIALKDPENNDLPIMNKSFKISMEEKNANGIIQFNKTKGSKMNQQNQTENGSNQQSSPRQKVSIKAANQSTLPNKEYIRLHQNDKIVSGMSPWRRSVDKMSNQEKDNNGDGEAMSPNILHSRLGNFSTVGPLSQNSQNSFDFKEKTIDGAPQQDLDRDSDYLKNLAEIKLQLANTIPTQSQKWVVNKTENNSQDSSTGPREQSGEDSPNELAIIRSKTKIVLPDDAVNFKTQSKLNLKQVQAISMKEKMQRFKNLGQSVRDVSKKNALQGLKNEPKTSMRRSGSNRSINTILTRIPYMNLSNQSSPQGKNPQGGQTSMFGSKIQFAVDKVPIIVKDDQNVEKGELDVVGDEASGSLREDGESGGVEDSDDAIGDQDGSGADSSEDDEDSDELKDIVPKHMGDTTQYFVHQNIDPLGHQEDLDDLDIDTPIMSASNENSDSVSNNTTSKKTLTITTPRQSGGTPILNTDQSAKSLKKLLSSNKSKKTLAEGPQDKRAPKPPATKKTFVEIGKQMSKLELLKAKMGISTDEIPREQEEAELTAQQIQEKQLQEEFQKKKEQEDNMDWIPKQKMSFADDKEEISKFLSSLNKKKEDLPETVKKYIEIKEKEKNDTFQQILDSKKNMSRISKQNLDRLPKKSAAERRKLNAVRTLSILAGPKTKISQQLLMAQQQIMNAFEDENWGNEKRKQAGGLNQPNQKHQKRAPKKGVSMLKTEIQKALLGDDGEDND